MFSPAKMIVVAKRLRFLCLKVMEVMGTG